MGRTQTLLQHDDGGRLAGEGHCKIESESETVDRLDSNIGIRGERKVVLSRYGGSEGFADLRPPKFPRASVPLKMPPEAPRR